MKRTLLNVLSGVALAFATVTASPSAVALALALPRAAAMSGKATLMICSYDLASLGYTQQEFLTSGAAPQPVHDAEGLATSGIRTPWIDVPTARASGSGNDSAVMASLFGSGERFDPATLQRLHPGGKAEYLGNFTVALDRPIHASFIVPDDHQEILDLAAKTYHGVD